MPERHYTPEDCERMLREMSPAARDYAISLDNIIADIRNGSTTVPLFMMWNLGAALFDAELDTSSKFSTGEYVRALKLDDALQSMIKQRYEIVDRWGK